MSAPRALECPSCGGPVRFQVNFCAYCRSALVWEQPLPLERGARLFSEKYPEVPMMGSTLLKTTDIEKTAQGHVVHVNAAKFLWAHSKICGQDLCVCVEGVALDRTSSFGAVVRAYAEGQIMGGYVVMLAPGFRSFRLTRNIEGSTLSASSVLEDWQCNPAVAPVGAPNQVEIRCADSMIQVLINGVRVLSTVDAGLGFGAFGWRASSLGAPARTLFRSLSSYEVASTGSAVLAR